MIIASVTMIFSYEEFEIKVIETTYKCRLVEFVPKGNDCNINKFG